MAGLPDKTDKCAIDYVQQVIQRQNYFLSNSANYGFNVQKNVQVYDSSLLALRQNPSAVPEPDP